MDPAADARGSGVAAIAAVIALSTTGCLAAGSPVGRVPGAEAPAGALATTPPDVWLAGQQPREPFVVFHLDRPAYVGIFEVRGSSARAIYPVSSGFGQRRLRAGMHVVEAGVPRRDAFHRFAAFAGVDDFRRPTVGVGCLASPVVYRLVVASHQPLRLENLVGDVAFRFQPVLSQRFAAMGEFRTMEYLIDQVVLGAGTGNQGWSAYYDALWVCGVDARPARPIYRRLPVLALLRVASTDGRDPPRRAPEGEEGPEAIRVATDAPGPPRIPRDAPALEAPVRRPDARGASAVDEGAERIRGYPVAVNLPGSVRITPARSGGFEVERRGFPEPRIRDRQGWSVPRPGGEPWAGDRRVRGVRDMIGGSWNPQNPPVPRVSPTPQRPTLGKPVKKSGDGGSGSQTSGEGSSGS